MRIEDMRVLVTGGGTGIGLETARALVEGGARVAICGRREAPLREAADTLGALPIQADVSAEADVRRLLDAVVEEMPDYNVLINNAAVGGFAPLLETETGDFERVFATNVTGAMMVARESARHFVRAGGGTIVNVGSTAATKGFPGGTSYAASKFALSGLTECWRAELRKHDVRVMQVNPSEVQTEFGGRDRPTENPTKLRSGEVAHLIVSLLTLDDRGFVTDATLWATNPR
jgi:3-oxoacyl-[acyl-carrier protein] reductase